MVTLPYRADVDGLRAVAVIAIILFHIGLGPLSGGFVGVDIFFVISGFLITGIIVKDTADGSFSLAGFWLRRIRRIFPALFLMLAVSVPLFGMVLPPDAFKNFGQSVAAQSFYVSNIWFWQQSGYFDQVLGLKPLRHTWSLSLEEQFYIFFPIFILLVRRFTKFSLWHIIALASVISFGLSIWGAAHKPSAAFFLLPTRAWELGIGALLAHWIIDAGNQFAQKWLDEFLAIIGAAAILYSVFVYTENTPFPSYQALLPTFGTALIIWANRSRGTVVGTFLAWRPLVQVGLLSYSIYLWHWPAIVFNRVTSFAPPVPISDAAAAAAGIVIALIAYKFVEQPLRRNRQLFSNKRLALGSAAAVLVVSLAGLGVHATGGLPGRIAPQILAQYELERQIEPWSECNRFNVRPDNFLCDFGDPGPGGGRVVLWGDSHAQAIFPAVKDAAQKLGFPISFAHFPGCPPVTGLSVAYRARTEHRCREFNQAVIKHIIDTGAPAVMLISRFAMYVEGWDIFDAGQDPFVTAHESRNRADKISARKDFAENFTAMVGVLRAHGVRVYVFRQVPNFNIDPPTLALKFRILGSQPAHRRSRRELDERTRFLGALWQRSDVKLIDITAPLCDSSGCSPFADGKSLYADNDHLNVFGNDYLGAEVVKQLAAVREYLQGRALRKTLGPKTNPNKRPPFKG
ncbi:MAG: acyltransferase [Rhodospirillaceae bacterium]|jgi:peptidoglycan/LPS O-acetylase OafA/YrhL|nr:acyltransferase [Rhodospirillaceae bacterium]MBT3887189.1 acyltransferase [Rhodospirillaceae bacterium]MBT4118871.1 acyltransferase [Rhodospirillaceae bacterium]MBT4674397.1 acyltransferase [Rhodospirillaceae bacterium]MBT4747941.1 acyltransferase [Rhodospirillaceae bacterium]